MAGTRPFPQLLEAEDAQQALNTFATNPLRILRAGPAYVCPPGGPPHLIPLVQVAPSPAVSDLIRRHLPSLDGDGAATYDWRFAIGQDQLARAVLRISFTAPATLIVSLEFDLYQHYRLLALALELGGLYITADAYCQEAIRFDQNALNQLAEPMALIALGMTQQTTTRRGK